jgi:hypothetical protein
MLGWNSTSDQNILQYTMLMVVGSALEQKEPRVEGDPIGPM